MNACVRRLSDCLGRLSEALTKLDHAAIDDCVAELEDSRLCEEAVTATDLAVLAFHLRSGAELAGSATNLYEGWSRIVSPPASAYSPDGMELAPPRRRSMNVDG
jgi:hypothetical protein